MKYTNNLVWRAVYEFVPAFKVAKASLPGFDLPGFDLPECLKTAAVECFIEQGLNGLSSLGMDRSYAAYIIQDALAELKKTGLLTFGAVEEYWQ